MRVSRLASLGLTFAALLAPTALVVAQDATPAASPVAAASQGVGSLNFLGEQRLSNLTMVDGTLVGGLSGLDYDPETGAWVLISDDRSQRNPARFYTAALDYGLEGFTSVEITGETTLLQTDGNPYPSPEEGGAVVDPEAIRFDPHTPGAVWWTSEGDADAAANPSITQSDAGGQAIGGIIPPAMFDVDPNEATGSRSNNSFEGLTFSVDGETIWVSTETALIQDGPVSTVEHGTVSRLTQYDRDGNVLAQFAYDVDPIQAAPTGDGADNGVSDILAIDDTHFLVLERSGVSTAEGPWDLYIRIYLIDISGATDVSDVASLDGAEYTPVSKEIVLNLADTDLEYTDNIEGISWGPVLENGNASIVLVSDNNFNETQVTQFLAYEVAP